MKEMFDDYVEDAIDEYLDREMDDVLYKEIETTTYKTKDASSKKVVITQTDFEILMAFREEGLRNESICTNGILQNLKQRGYFKYVDNNMPIEDILAICEIS
ncbi:MAG: hypothetical protein ACLSVX_02710 [Massilimicrobiota timonensis]